MSTATAGAAGVIVGKRALHHLRTVLERETGPQAALLLREIGFATGEAVYEAFEAWSREQYHVAHPRELDAGFLAAALSGFFGEAGWGSVTVTELAPAVLALDTHAWAEAEPHGAEYPSCHFSSGMLADFFTRLGGSQAAVMEVECASRGEARCRFLVGSPDMLTYVYERMTTGMSYAEAVTGEK
jgi:predicted hydrocarbon binding protein